MKVLIFGAGSTLAQAIIDKLVKNGDEVCGVLHGDKLDTLINIPYISNIDVSDQSQMLTLEQMIREQFGVPNHVINCVGISEYHDFVNGKLDDYYRVFRVNYDSSVNSCYVGARMMATHGGAITLVGSGYGHRHIPLLSSYCASKGALSSLVRVLSVELAMVGVRINLVTPGIFPSQMTEPFLSNDNYTKQLINHIPDRSFGSAEMVAEAILFLGSDKATHINGTDLVIDGGMLNLIEGGITR